MNKTSKTHVKNEKTAEGALKHTKEIKYQESPIERALKLSSGETLARAIRDMMDRDRLN